MKFKISTTQTSDAPTGTVTTLSHVTSFNNPLATKDLIRERNHGVTRRVSRGRRLETAKFQCNVLESEVASLLQTLKGNAVNDADAVYIWWEDATGSDYYQIWLHPDGTFKKYLYAWIRTPVLDSSYSKWFKISFSVKSAWEST